MRADILSLALASLLCAVNTAPTGRRDGKRDNGSVARPSVTVTDAGVTTPTTATEVLVYKDKDGKVLRTTTEVVAIVPPTPAPNVGGSNGNDNNQQSRRETAEVDVELEDEASVGHDDAAVVMPRAGPKNGVTYSPYKANGQCKNAAEVLRDFQHFKGSYSMVRLYGVDCDQVKTGMAAAKAIGVKLFLGIFNMDNIPGQVNTLKAGVAGNWGIVDTVSFGNELVNNGRALGAVLAGLKQTRDLLRAAGYKGPVVTCDTFVAVAANPALCDQSDYCAMNMHPFFDGNVKAEQAGRFVADQRERIRRLLKDKNKRIVITETGWPWKGSPNRSAVPSKPNQDKAVASIRGAFSANPGDLILFTAYNDEWKKDNAATFNAEKWWGMHGNAPSH